MQSALLIMILRRVKEGKRCSMLTSNRARLYGPEKTTHPILKVFIPVRRPVGSVLRTP